MGEPRDQKFMIPGEIFSKKSIDSNNNYNDKEAVEIKSIELVKTIT